MKKSKQSDTDKRNRQERKRAKKAARRIETGKDSYSTLTQNKHRKTWIDWTGV